MKIKVPLALFCIALVTLGAGKIPRGNINYYAEGDSTTSGFAATNGGYPGVLIFDGSNNSSYFNIVNNATAGARVDILAARSTELNTHVSATFSNKLSVLIGVNDFNNSVTSAQYLINYAAYLDGQRAAGWKVAACTLLPATAAARPDKLGVSYATWRGIVNPVIRTWVPSHADAICDFAADPVMGPDAAASDVALYPDGLHPSNAGSVILESVIVPVLAAMN